MEAVKLDEVAKTCAPCSCIGSVKYVHVKCLKEWIKTSGSVQCEICHKLYNVRWIEWAFEKHCILNKDEEEDKISP